VIRSEFDPAARLFDVVPASDTVATVAGVPPWSVTLIPFSICGVNETGSLSLMADDSHVIVVVCRNRGHAAGLPWQPHRWELICCHVRQGPTPVPPQVDDVQLFESLAHPEALAGSMYQLGTVQLDGMIGTLVDVAITTGFFETHRHDPSAPVHAACVICAEVLRSGFGAGAGAATDGCNRSRQAGIVEVTGGADERLASIGASDLDGGWGLHAPTRTIRLNSSIVFIIDLNLPGPIWCRPTCT